MREIPVLYLNKENCCGCKACANACPKDAISFGEDEYGFFYPKIDDGKCIRCQKCVQTCDFQKKEGGVEKRFPQRCYAAVHKSADVLRRSTSGGVFSALADIVFDDGGVVFGCVFDETMTPKHVCAETPEQLLKMHGSKYVQSDVDHTYRQTKDFLEAGRHVLYSGTPCQIAGLQSYLGKKYNNLITLDVICHGTPSAGMFHQYIAYVERQKRVKIKDFHFRSKKKGWGILDYNFDQEYKTNKNDNWKKIPAAAAAAYMQNFRRNNLHRNSCFSCPYARPERTADFTMGDFWGYKNVNVSLESKKGLSILLANSEKAVAFMPQIAERMSLESVPDIDRAVHTNGNLYRPSPKGDKWDYFMAAYANGEFESALQSFSNENKKDIGKARIKRMIPIPLYLKLKEIKSRITRKGDKI